MTMNDDTPFWMWFHKTKTWPDVAFALVITLGAVATLWLLVTH